LKSQKSRSIKKISDPKWVADTVITLRAECVKQHDMSANYPEHDKLIAIQDQSQAIGEFLEWARIELGYSLGEYHEHTQDCFDIDGGRICGMRTEEMYAVNMPVTNLLAKFFNIDQDKLEEEKRAMLKALRNG